MPINSISRHTPKSTENQCPDKNLYTNVCSSIICNSLSTQLRKEEFSSCGWKPSVLSVTISAAIPVAQDWVGLQVSSTLQDRDRWSPDGFTSSVFPFTKCYSGQLTPLNPGLLMLSALTTQVPKTRSQCFSFNCKSKITFQKRVWSKWLEN